MSKRFEASIQARIPARIVRELERLAETNCQTLSALIRAFIVRGLRQFEKAEANREKEKWRSSVYDMVIREST